MPITGSGFPLTVTTYNTNTKLGTATIPRKPTRVVIIDATQVIDSALALKVNVVGVTSDAKKAGYGSLYATMLKSVPGVGSRPNFDFEKIAALKPELIIGLPAEFDQNFAKFNAIAPTVGIPYVTTQLDWQFFPEQVALLTGTQANLGPLMTQMSNAAKPIQARFSKGYKVALLQSFPAAKKFLICYFTPGRLYTYLGATVNPAAKTNNCNPLTAEQLATVTDPNIFVANNDGNNSDLAYLRSQALWKTLPAVKANHVYYVPSYFFYAGGPIAYLKTLSEIPSVITDLPS